MGGTASSIVLALLLATAYAAMFHFFIGGSLRRFLLYVIVAWIGFLAGQFIGQAAGIDILKLGPLHLLTASAGTWVALGGAWWLAGRNA